MATYGNPGQSPYSAANSLLDSLSRYRNAKGLPCTAMQWAGSFSASYSLLSFAFRRDGVEAVAATASMPHVAAMARLDRRATPRRDGRAAPPRRHAAARDPPKRHRRDTYNAGWGEVGMAAGLEGLARKRMEESPMPFFTNAQGLAGMDVGLSTGVSPFCVMRYNASAFFDQSNAEAKNASAHYMRKFWGQSIPPKELTELDVYDAVKSNFYEPHELTFAHFISGSELDEP